MLDQDAATFKTIARPPIYIYDLSFEGISRNFIIHSEDNEKRYVVTFVVNRKLFEYGVGLKAKLMAKN